MGLDREKKKTLFTSRDVSMPQSPRRPIRYRYKQVVSITQLIKPPPLSLFRLHQNRLSLRLKRQLMVVKLEIEHQTLCGLRLV